MGLQANPILPQERRQDEPATPAGTTQQTPDNRFHFPAETWKQLDGVDLRLLEEIAYLSDLQRKKSPTGARYCCPSELYLSQKIGVRREAISRHVNKLAELGVLSVTHRRKKGGNWQTNLYKVVKWVYWKVRQAVSGLRGKLHRVRPTAHIAIPMRENKSAERQSGGPSGIKGTLTELVDRIRRGERLE